MKVKCIDNKGNENYLTISKIYDAIYNNEIIYYHIQADDGYTSIYRQIYFKTLSEIRNEKIDKLLNYEI
jgi:hypothetical protein